MAAYCTCCGAEITLKAEACPVCGAPRHGTLRSDQSEIIGAQIGPVQDGLNIGSEAPPDAPFSSRCERQR